jgi:hypothetical protein
MYIWGICFTGFIGGSERTEIIAGNPSTTNSMLRSSINREAKGWIAFRRDQRFE